MAKKSKDYTRLTWNLVGGTALYNLWLARDHLLIVKSTGFNESYARLQFRDIKGFFIAQTDRRLGWAIAWILLVALFLIIILAQVNDHETPLISLVLFILSIVGGVWNHVLGPGCDAYVVTGVQTAKLSALVRHKKALRALARLQPLIEAAQADLVVAVPTPPVVSAPVAAAVSPVSSPEPVAGAMETPVAAVASVSSIPPPADLPAAAPPAEPAAGAPPPAAPPSV